MAADQPTNVVLTADTSQYNQSMTQSAQATDGLGASVDSLTRKISALTKSAGRRLLGISAAETATITAATLAYGAFEKQMTSLNVQASLLTKTMGGQSRVFDGYSNDVNKLRRDFGLATGEAAQLEQTITKMADHTASIQALGKSFGQLGKATGESTVGLANSMLQLQRTMGTPNAETNKFNNQLLTLQSRANTSAGAILDFSQSIAPLARVAGLSQTEVMGLSTGFIKAGQDGYLAGNVFNKVMTDITRATRTGSPVLTQYADLVGKTTKQFKETSGGEQFLEVIEALNKAGPRAASTMDRLGLDGTRLQKVVSAISQQGGLRAEVNAAQNADPGNLKKGSDTAMNEMFDQMKRLRIELTETGEAIGHTFAGPAKIFFGVLINMAKAVRAVADSPLGTIAAWGLGAAAIFTSVAGAILLASKALLTFASANWAYNSAFGQGVRGVNKGLPGDAAASGFTRNSYMVGAGARSLAPSGFRAGLSNAVGRTLSGAGTAMRYGAQMFYGPGSVYIPGVPGTGGFDDPVARQGWGSGRPDAPPGFRETPAGRFASIPGRFGAVGRGFTEQMARLAGPSATYGAGLIGPPTQEQAQAAERSAAALRTVERGATTATRGMLAFGRGAANAMAIMAGTAGGAAKLGGGIARNAYSLIGGNPLLGTALAGFGIYEALKTSADMETTTRTDTTGLLDPYYKSAGISAPPTAATVYGQQQPTKLTRRQAVNIDQSDIDYAQSGSYKLKNPALKNLSTKEIVSRLSQEWPSLSKKPKAINEIAHDLVAIVGPGAARDIIAGLEAKNRRKPGDIQGLLSEAADPGMHGFVGNLLYQQSGKVSGQKLDLFLDGLQRRTDMLTQQRGADFAQADKAKQLDMGFKNYFAQIDKQDRRGGLKGINQFVMNRTNRGDLAQSFDEKMAFQLFRINKEDLDFQHPNRFDYKGVIPTGKDTHVKDRKSFIHAAFQFGFLKDPKLLKQALRNLDLPENLTGDAAEKAINNRLDHPPKETVDRSLGGGLTSMEKVGQVTAPLFGGKNVLDLPQVAGTVFGGEDSAVKKFESAQFVANRILQLPTVQQQTEAANKFLSATNANPLAGSEVAEGAKALVSRQQEQMLPYMNRAQQFHVAKQQVLAAEATPLSDSYTPEMQRADEDAFKQKVQDQYNFVKQMLYQQREYEVMRKRAQDDYHQQQMWQQEAFDRQRARAERDFARQRRIAVADFNRQEGRALFDYHLQRKQQEEDHNHQVQLMVKQQAMQVYDIYKRVDVERTTSASYLLVNAQDQLERIQEQSGNLDKLRGMGLSKNAIQQLGFNDPNKAQELARFVAEATSDPKLIKEFNESVIKRLRAAKKLVTDESSLEWTEFNRTYMLGRTRGQEQFERSMKNARADFTRGLKEQNEQFQTQLKDQQEEYKIGVDHMHTQHVQQLNRAAEDLDRAATTIDGSMEKILKKGMTDLSGHARAQVQTIVTELGTLESDTRPPAIRVMKSLAGIFGLDWTAPPVLKGAGAGAGAAGNAGSTARATGGVLPGYTPGKDVHHFYSPTAGDLHLSGGEAIMVPEWTRAMGGEHAVNEMNAKARRGYFLGGTIPLRGAHSSQHSSQQYPFARWAGDLNVGSGYDDYGMAVHPWRVGKVAQHNYVGDRSYGRWVIINHTGNQSSLYAHLSKFGAPVGAQVNPSDVIGYVGNLGNTGTPPTSHLHFEIRGGNVDLADAGSAAGAAGAQGSGARSLSDILKKYYPRPEENTARMAGAHIFQRGDISRIINRFAREKYHKMVKKYGAPSAATGAAAAGDVSVTDIGDQPSGHLDNEHIVHTAANRLGWGDQWGALRQLIMHESGFRNTVKNPKSTAYGMFQFLDKTWAAYGGHKTSDPWLQTQYGMRYIKSRYNDPAGAWKFWQNNGYYGAGAIFSGGPSDITVGERGSELVLPLNDRGTTFMAEVMSKYQSGKDARGMNQTSIPINRGNVLVHNYDIDRSTNFTGPITVRASNPQEFITQLRARNAVQALSQAAIGGQQI